MRSHSVLIHGVLVLLFFCLLLNLPYIHLREFQGEEGRRVIIAKTMFKTGEWIVPHVENVPYLKKPPLFNWLLAGIFTLTGIVSETTARMLSVLSAFLCALSLSVFWRKAAGIEDTWFVLPGMIFLTFTDVMDKSVRAEIDMTFTLFTTLAVLLWFFLYEHQKKPLIGWIVSLSFVSVATLTKGLQAPAFFYCGVLPYLIYKKEIRNFFSVSHFLGLFVALAIFSAWFIPFTEKVGMEAVLKTWWHEIATRQEPIKAGGFFRHFVEFPFFYFIAYLPWLPLMFLWVQKEIRDRATGHHKLVMYCIFFLLFSVPFYWIMPGARLRYILPVSGMLALLLTIPLSLVSGDFCGKRMWIKRYWQLFGILSFSTVLTSPFWGRRFDLFQGLVPVLLLVVVFSLSLFLIVQKGEMKKKLVLFLFLILSIKVLWASLYFPYHAQYLSHYRTAAKQINTLVPPDVTLYDYRVDNQHLAYYLNRPVTLIKLIDTSTMKNGTVVLMAKKDADRLDLKGLSFIGEVKARRERLLLYKIVDGGQG